MTMIAAFIRSTLFNVAFFIMTLAMMLCVLPTLLMPREKSMRIVHLWVNTIYCLERWLLNLDYQIRGAENIPQGTAYLLASKHESSYETFKLHRILGDPAIVLKRELLNIPIWGLFLKKIDPIAIDRSNRDQAIKSLLAGVDHVRAQGRPIVIFPQGTRVKWNATTAEKPYKGGVAKMQDSSGLPIIPLALNTGVFWPKASWIKKPGTVIFEFLPAIPPGKPVAETMALLETVLETACNDLHQEALKTT